MNDNNDSIALVRLADFLKLAGLGGASVGAIARELDIPFIMRSGVPYLRKPDADTITREAMLSGLKGTLSAWPMGDRLKLVE
jgi:hypothetical protein